MPPTSGSARLRISVVVPVRDDPRIDDLLVSLAAQTGSLFFLIVFSIAAAHGYELAVRHKPSLSLASSSSLRARLNVSRDPEGFSKELVRITIALWMSPCGSPLLQSMRLDFFFLQS